MLSLDHHHNISTLPDPPRAYHELPAHPGPRHPPHPASPLAKQKNLPDTLLVDYLAGYTAARLCSSYNITLPELFAWLRDPKTQQLLDEHERFAAAQLRHVQQDKEPEIILTLCAIATRGTSESECRRAASDLLRAFKFRDYLDRRQQRAPATTTPIDNPPSSPTRKTQSDSAPQFPNSRIAPTTSNPPVPRAPAEKPTPDSSRLIDTARGRPINPQNTDDPDTADDAHDPLDDEADRIESFARLDRLAAHSDARRAPQFRSDAAQVQPHADHQANDTTDDDLDTPALEPHRNQPAPTPAPTSAPRIAHSRAPNAESAGSTPPHQPSKLARQPLNLRHPTSPLDHPLSPFEAEVLTPPPEVPERSPPAPDPPPDSPFCLNAKPTGEHPSFDEMVIFMPPPAKTFNPFWPESDILFRCNPDRTDTRTLRNAIADHQEMLARRGAQALVDRNHFSPDQQNHQAYVAATEFYQQLARKNPPPDH